MRGARVRGVPTWAIGAAGVVLATVVVTIAGTVMAILGANLACMGGASALAAPATKTAVREIPPQRLRIYQEAGRRIDIDWAFLASIGYQECGHGACAQVYPSGCAGPMAIAYVRGSACSPDPSVPTIWERYETDGDGDGEADVFNPADAVFTAARILREALGAPPAGGSYAAYREAACGYYGACGDSLANYADEVMARAVDYGFAGKGAPAPTGAAVEVVVAAGEGSGSACGSESSSGSASGSEIVRIAQSQLGTVESPLGTNCNPYGPCVEWCSLFVAWVWKKAGVPLEGSTATYAFSGDIYKWAAAHESKLWASAPGESPLADAEPNGARVLSPTETPAPGDAVLYGTGAEFGESLHIGIVERVFPNGEITTIDGNLSDRVMRAGPFLPPQATAAGLPGPIFGYAHPPRPGGGDG